MNRAHSDEPIIIIIIIMSSRLHQGGLQVVVHQIALLEGRSPTVVRSPPPGLQAELFPAPASPQSTTHDSIMGVMISRAVRQAAIDLQYLVDGGA
jgi:hypothetical protein